MARKDSFNKTWASNPAQFEKPGDALIERGWAGGASEDPPEAKWENWWHNRLDEALLEIQNSGALAWFSDAKYTKGALVNYGGKNWVALSANSNISPNGSLDNGIWLEVEYSKSDFLKKSQNGADIPDKNAFVKNLGLVETVALARNSAQQSFVDANFARGNIGVVNTKSIYPLINFLPPDGKESRGFFAIEANLTNDNEQSIYLYKRDAAGNNIYLVNFPNKNGTLATLDDIVPVGVPLPHPHRYTPVGYLTCNGQTFDKSKYPKLAEAYPSGRLLDLRGEFIRGWDDSRGVDPGRVCGTWQADGIPDHNHYKVASKQLVEDLVLTGSESWSTSKGSARSRSLDQNTYTGGVNGTTANETRPRNVAFNYIVRAI